MELLQPLLADGVPRESLDGFQYSTLGAAIKKVWKYAKGRAMTVTDIHDLLATGRLDDDGASSAGEGDRRLKDLAAMLHPYTRDGAYGKYFDSEASIDFGADLIVLELEELKSKKDLQTVVLLIVMYRITREMYFSRDPQEDRDHRRGLGPALRRRHRRVHRGRLPPPRASTRRLHVGHRGVDDYYRNRRRRRHWTARLDVPAAPEARVDRDDGQARSTHDGRCDEAAAAVAAHRARRLPEVFIHSPAGNGIGRLIVDPYSLLLFSSRAEDFNAINAKRAAAWTSPPPSTRSCANGARVNAPGRRTARGRQRAGERRADRARSPVARARSACRRWPCWTWRSSIA